MWGANRYKDLIVFGDHTKVVKYVDFDFVAGADGIKVIKPDSVFFPKFVYYYLKIIDLPDKGYARHFQFLEKSKIPLPPLPEQHRIVAKIEELFTKLDAGVAALEKLKAQLKRYRQSVLKAAFSGKLTAQWREEHKDELEPSSVLLGKIKEARLKTKEKKKELPPVDTSDLPELPEGWEWARVGDFASVKDGKRLPKGHGYSKTPTDYPYIRVVDFEDLTIQKERFTISESRNERDN